MVNIPRCIRPLTVDEDSELVSQVDRGAPFRGFQIGCPCGEDSVELLGYEAESQAAPGEGVFIGPLGMRCVSCGTESEIMDPETDGYNGEIDSNTTMRGSGVRTSWRCPQCKNSRVHAAVVFAYQVEVDEEMAERPEDFFDVFQLFAVCCQCGELREVTAFDCT